MFASPGLGLLSSGGDAGRAPGGLTRGRVPGEGVVSEQERPSASERETLAGAARRGAWTGPEAEGRSAGVADKPPGPPPQPGSAPTTGRRDREGLDGF